jgi:membrane protease YdiL (CAAX protease family)
LAETKPEIGPKLEPSSLDNASGLTDLVILGIFYLLVFAAAEWVAPHLDYASIIIYLALLLGLIISSAVNKDETQRKLWLALALVPLIRIISLVIPLPEISVIFWYIIIALPIFVGIFTVSRVSGYSINDVGLNGNKPAFQILVAVSGVAFALVDYYILKPEALNTQLTLQSTLLPALILLIATGFAEELAFRGVMQRAASALNSRGWIYIAIVYAVLQIGHGSALHCIFALGVGLFYGWIVKKTGSILGVAFSHGLLNIGLYLILPHLF